MPKNKVSEWSSSPGNNTDVGGINIAEGCAPSNINNAIREVMAQIKDMQSGTDSDNFTVGGNLSVAGSATITGGLTANVTGNLTGNVTGTVATATNALSLGGNLANTYAPLASPAFTGAPTAPTPLTSDNSTKLATTEFVSNKISAVSSGVTTFSAGTTGLTPNTATSGAVTLGGTLAVANGGTGATTAAAARTNLGSSTVGDNLFTLANPSAVTFLRLNADNTVSALNATDFKTAIGATGTGTVTSITAGSYLNGGTITTSGTISVNASSSNVLNAIVARDASGNFTASTITANLNGNASTATSATTATTASSATSATTATNIAGGGAGRIPYNTGTGATSFVAAGTSGQILQSNGTSAPTWATGKLVESSTGSALYYGARAWVNFTGSGSAVLVGSVNVTSVARSATGTYTVNLTTAMPDTNGAIACGYYVTGNNVDQMLAVWNSTSQIGVFTEQTGTAARDVNNVYLAVFR